MTINKRWEEELGTILGGIDKTECEHKNGWWETSTGAEFGGKKKQELESLISKVEKEAYQRAVEETEKKYEPLLIHSTRVENEKLLVTLELRDPKNVTHFYKREELQALKGEEITFFEQEKERWSEETKRRREDLD